MKIQILTLLCAFAIYDIAVADDVQTQLKAMEAERESISKLKGSSKTFYSENCPKYLDFWQQSAAQGQAIAQSFLGVCYSYGKGIAKDETQAVAWYRKAAEQGYAPAQANLGVMYRDGKGIAKDETQALTWLRKAAEQGYAPAQVNLGSIYANSRGMAKDEVQAIAWFTKAAEQGYVPAQANLGAMYRDGKGVAKDETQSAVWFRKADEQDMPNDMLAQLGRLCKEYDDQPNAMLKTDTYKKSLEIIDKANKNGINNWLGTLSKIRTGQEDSMITLSISIGSSTISDRGVARGTPAYKAARAMRENEKVMFSGVHLTDYNFAERRKLCDPDFEIEFTSLSKYTVPETSKQTVTQASTESLTPAEAPAANAQAQTNDSSGSVVTPLSKENEESLQNSANRQAGVAIDDHAQTTERVEQDKTSSSPQAAADAQSCLDLARTGMIGDAQEVMCNFKGGIKEKFMRIYADAGCGKLVARGDLDKARTEMLMGMKNKLRQMGEKSYCKDAKGYYDGVVKALNLATSCSSQAK